MKSVLLPVICVLLVCDAGWSQSRNKKRDRELQQELSLDPDPKKLKKEVRPQVLDVPKEPPQAVAVESTRLAFYVSPLSGKGLLSQQVRDGLRALTSSARGAPIVKIRAFVAGTGDMRRVQAIVSETFEERRQPLPALSVVQVGGLPHEAAQVVMEATALERKPVLPYGVAFVAAQEGSAKDAAGPLKSALTAASLDASGVRRVTCFLNSLDYIDAVRTQIVEAFPEASANYVQLRRDSAGDFVSCEAVAGLSGAPSKPVEITQYAAKLGPGKLVLSGTQMAFGREDADVRLAFDRLDKALESAGTDLKQVIFARVYSLTNSVAQQVVRLRSDYFDSTAEPATSSLIFEGLPALEASVGLDVIARAK
jgi:enamine deaminase RidA (YjgF/YER057c/UK114 family)